MIAPLELEEAQTRLFALAAPLPIERIAVSYTLGRWLAEPLFARRIQPAADSSSMDGYAVRSDDIAGPWQVIGESAAGHPFVGALAQGGAVRISTGAHLPAGAGVVIVQEDVSQRGDSVHLTGTPPAPLDLHIRRAGSDFAAQDELSPAGTRVAPAHVALALAAGCGLLAIHGVPRIVVLDCGDELASDPTACPPHQVPASNGAMLVAMLAELPCEVTQIGPIGDDLGAIARALAQAGDVDVIVTSGGASVGDHDLLRPTLAKWGAEIDFWRVAIKPGKPLLVGRKGRTVVLGLPGNPVSSFVTATLFLLPLVRALSGARDPLPTTVLMPLRAALGPGGTRREFLRARWDGEGVTAERVQDSGGLAALARSNALIDRPANDSPLTIGAMVGIIPLALGGST